MAGVKLDAMFKITADAVPAALVAFLGDYSCFLPCCIIERAASPRGRRSSGYCQLLGRHYIMECFPESFLVSRRWELVIIGRCRARLERKVCRWTAAEHTTVALRHPEIIKYL